MGKQDKITIDDIANASGVSVSTVSRILNDKPDVAAATRARVQRVIRNLGYTPQIRAQQLASGKNRTIALLFHRDYADFSQQELDFVAGAAIACGEEDYFIHLNANPVTEQNLLGLYQSGQVDGVILMEIHTEDWRVDLLHSEDLPFVMIGHCRDSRDISFIDLDFEVGVVKAFDYLVELGHQRIGFLAYPPALHTSGLGLVAASDRGYATALEKYGLPRICREVAMETGAMEAATDELLNEEPALTAIVSLNGDVVVGVLRALRNRDIRVPDAFSVLGLTITSTAMLMIPALTTLDFPTKQVGYDATKLLIQRLEDRESGVQQRLLEPALIVRESTGPAPT